MALVAIFSMFWASQHPLLFLRPCPKSSWYSKHSSFCCGLSWDNDSQYSPSFPREAKEVQLLCCLLLGKAKGRHTSDPSQTDTPSRGVKIFSHGVGCGDDWRTYH